MAAAPAVVVAVALQFLPVVLAVRPAKRILWSHVRQYQLVVPGVRQVQRSPALSVRLSPAAVITAAVLAAVAAVVPEAAEAEAVRAAAVAEVPAVARVVAQAVVPEAAEAQAAVVEEVPAEVAAMAVA